MRQLQVIDGVSLQLEQIACVKTVKGKEVELLPVLINVLKDKWWVIPLIIFASAFKLPVVKGFIGESFVKLVGRLRLGKDVYHPRHNVTLELEDGTTQIDHIYISKYGIFVVETKNMKGWIFGSEKQASWTQKIYKKTYKFQNPLRQNFRHTQALIEKLNVSGDSVFSVIAFVGDCELKTEVPRNVTRGTGYVDFIKSKKKILFSEEDIQQIVSDIDSKSLVPSLPTNRKHVRSLNERHNSKLTKLGEPVEPICQRCGNRMVKRLSKNGVNAGSEFWGCSVFPKCRYTMKIE